MAKGVVISKKEVREAFLGKVTSQKTLEESLLCRLRGKYVPGKGNSKHTIPEARMCLSEHIEEEPT